MKKILILFVLIPSIFLSSIVLSSEEVKNNLEIPPGLDFKTRKATRRLIEFEPFGGEYLGNLTEYSFIVGGRLGFRVTEAITVGAEFNYSRINYDPTSDFGRSVTAHNEYIVDAYMNYAFPILQRAGKTIQEADLFVTLGIGDVHINAKNRLAGLIGGGIKVFFSNPEWLALRFDVNTYLYSIPTLNSSQFGDDWTFSVGPSFLFMPKKPKTSS